MFPAWLTFVCYCLAAVFWVIVACKPASLAGTTRRGTALGLIFVLLPTLWNTGAVVFA